MSGDGVQKLACTALLAQLLGVCTGVLGGL